MAFGCFKRGTLEGRSCLTYFRHFGLFKPTTNQTLHENREIHKFLEYLHPRTWSKTDLEQKGIH